MNSHRIWIGYACAVSATLACTGAGLAMATRFDVVNIAMVYLLAVVLIALSFSRGAAVLCAVLSVLAFDVMFVPPRGRLTVDDAQYLLTFAIMVAVALVIAGLMESRRRQSVAQAKLALEAETERVRNTLLASISHDLRTPLSVMMGASSSLMEIGERLSQEQRQALAQSIYQQTCDMAEQVEKLLQMTRLENGAIRLSRDWAAVSEMVDAALSRLSARLSAHRVIVDISENLPLLRVDAMLVDQALVNLLENAAKHTAAGTLVHVRARQVDNQIRISVEDFGPGIDENNLELVFAKFQHGANEHTAGGVGLGLAITRTIVSLHGGRTWAERIPGGGTAFHFTLPLEEVPRPPAEATHG